MNRGDLADPVGPVPVGQNVSHRQGRPPAGLVKVKANLLKPGKVQDAKIRAARGYVDLAGLVEFVLQTRFGLGIREFEHCPGVLIIRSWLPQIIEASPNKLTRHEGKLILAFEFSIGRHRPRRGAEIIRADLEIGAPTAFIIANGKEVFSTRADAGGSFTAKERLVGIGIANLAVLARLIVIAENVDLFLEAVI